MACSGRSATLNPVSVLNQASAPSLSSHVAAVPRPSACPGLLRIVAARDGGICRIRLPGGELTSAQAAAIAHASGEHASGVIELTNRGNLQIRGVWDGHESTLTAALIDAGLGPDGATVSPAADDVRNVMISPLAGRDPFALIDTRPLCAALLALLQSEARFAALSPKFAMLVDGGERLARLDHPHDVWLAAFAFSPVASSRVESSPDNGGVRFVIGLAGSPSDADALIAVAPSHAAAVVRALLHAFLDLAEADTDNNTTRMRHLLATHSVDTILQRAQHYVDFPLTRDASLQSWQRTTAADASLRFGAHVQRENGLWHAGAQPPLGRLDAAALKRLAVLAKECGNGTLHVTPWQSVLLPDLAEHEAPAVMRELHAIGLACDPAQPLARLIACAGSIGCAKSAADTKADAQRLAQRLPAGVEAHLSGCAHSCAAAHCAPYTLLAVAPGLYDLYQRDDGEAAEAGFGRCITHHLPIEQAASLLDRLPRSAPDA
ncbi:MAG: Precorrin-3B synthase [uncultured Paraburkholderia sp.]|nr:MAG: Precorrin-3B synthase [uncultured Paraburkholderia sp.]CAH2936104.1 MAG: Precorrin-3B synthase [uncultured Paraburkholderia sp.]